MYKQIYYHREYANDINNLPDPGIRECAAEQSWLDQGRRVATTALPFLALYKPLSLPLSLTMGGLRTIGAANQFVVALQTGTVKDISWALLETVIAVISLVGTLLAHPLGMLITTGHDLVIEMTRVIENAKNGEFMKIAESLMSMANNGLYLALMLDGSIGLSIASLASQMLIATYHAQAEFKKENFIEGMGHLLMALVRGNQMMGQIAIAMRTPEPKPNLDQKLTDEELMKRAQETNNKTLINVLNKYHCTGRFAPALYNAVDACDWPAVELLIHSGALVQYPQAYGRDALLPPILPLAVDKLHHMKPNQSQPSYEIFELLLKNGAAINIDFTAENYKKWFSGPLAVRGRPIADSLFHPLRLDLLELFLKHGMNPNVIINPLEEVESKATLLTRVLTWNGGDFTPEKKLKIFELFLKYKADPNLHDLLWTTVDLHAVYGDKGDIAERFATRRFYEKIAEMLIQNGADINKINPNTPQNLKTPRELALHNYRKGASPDLWIRVFSKYGK